MNTDTILILLAVFLLIIGVFAVLFLVRIQKTLNQIDVTLLTLNQHLPGILTNMENITTNVNRVTGQVNKQVEGFAVPALRLQTLLLNMVVSLEDILQLPLFRVSRNLRAVSKGFEAFIQTFRSQ
ncbi:MAG: DUF948 domain-containing protein [Deltaproteobacteria bacterium]|nr:DUF948 domain-containing protein [Deltaproteobacteria bacterium]